MLLHRCKFSSFNNIGKQFRHLYTVPNVSNKIILIDISKQYPLKNSKSNISRSCTIFQNVSRNTTNTHETISSINLKKRVVRKKKSLEDEVSKPGIYNVVAFATAEEYNLENLIKGLEQQDLYEPKNFENAKDIIHAIAKYQVEKEPREIFFFRDGSIVLWNVTDLESSNILNFVRQYEEDSYSERLVQAESEVMKYKYSKSGNKLSCIDKDGDFVLALKEGLSFDKFAVSNAMMMSVKLGIWEASLEKFISEIELLTEDLKSGKKIKMSREEVLKKHGELFALRHYLNLSSDVLDTPDFYWEYEDLENLYNQICAYFSINKRTKVMNEKLNHCVALIELVASHLSDKHHVRLEWMIIILIMVEVVFEIIHYIDRFTS